MSVRITGGEHRGRRLRAPTVRGLRPTTEVARSAVFSILGQGALGGTRVLDAEKKIRWPAGSCAGSPRAATGKQRKMQRPKSRIPEKDIPSFKSTFQIPIGEFLHHDIPLAAFFRGSDHLER